MAFSPQELEIINFGKTNGKSREEIESALGKFRATQTTTTAKPKSTSETITDGASAVTDFLGLGAATDVFGRAIARTRAGAAITGTDVEANRANIEAPSKRQLAGAALQTGITAASPLIPAKLPLKTAVAAGVGAGYAFDIGQDLAEGKSTEEVLTPGIGAAAGVVGPLGGPAAKGTTQAVKKGVETVNRAVTSSPLVKGGLQTAIDYAERVPRFISKKQVQLRDQATKAERLATAPAPVRQALQANVPEPIINTIEQADEATKEGYRQIVQLAEESVSTTGTLKTTARPEIVAGEAVASQYKLVDEQKKKVGQAIGEQVRQLSKSRPVPMDKPRAELSEALADVGVAFKQSASGEVSLDFGRTGFTKAQRAKITELYELATEGGPVLTPAEIHAKDRLFSQLQREARMESVGDILVPNPADPEGRPISLFQAFRDVYSNTLEEAAPEIRGLNRQYRNLSTFVDEIEDTLVKTGKFETNSRVDPSEYAQTNLRRLFSEAQSAADYRAIADELDQASRALGYEGAVPSDLARFALEIRKIYPDTTPRTGIEGVMRSSTSIGNIIDTVVNAGRPELEDQQKALRALLEASESLQQ